MTRTDAKSSNDGNDAINIAVVTDRLTRARNVSIDEARSLAITLLPEIVTAISNDPDSRGEWRKLLTAGTAANKLVMARDFDKAVKSANESENVAELTSVNTAEDNPSGNDGDVIDITETTEYDAAFSANSASNFCIERDGHLFDARTGEPISKSFGAAYIVSGLQDDEKLVKLMVFDGEKYVVIVGNRNRATWTRSAHVQKPKPGESDTDEKNAVKLVPIMPGFFSVESRRIVVDVENTKNDRSVRDTVSDESVTVVYHDAKGYKKFTEIPDSELLKTQGAWNWLTRLGITAHIRQDQTRYGMVRNLYRATVHDATESFGAETPVTRAVATSGIMRDRRNHVYVAPNGSVLTRKHGGESTLSSLITGGSEVLDDIGYEDVDDERAADGLSALSELLNATNDTTAGYVALGALTAAPWSAFTDQARGATVIVGATKLGKTTFAQMLAGTQFRNVARPGSMTPPIDMRIKLGKSGNTTMVGIRTNVEPYAGALVVTDDATKRNWPVALLDKANSELITPLIMGVAPGVASPAQGRIKDASEGGGVGAAKPLKLRNQVIITMETLPVTGLVANDSALNRAIIIQWTDSSRAPRDVFTRLNTLTHNNAANDGMAALHRWILNNADKWTELYAKALDMVADIADSRSHEKYAVRLVGLLSLDAAMGVTDGLANRAVPYFLRNAEWENTLGSETSEGRASYDLIAAVRESIRIALGKRAYFAGSKLDINEADVAPLTPDQDIDLPNGYGLRHIGWLADFARVDGEIIPAYKTPAGAVRIGHIRKTRANMSDAKTKILGSYFVRMDGRERGIFVDLIREISERHGWRVGTRPEIFKAIEDAGIGIASTPNEMAGDNSRCTLINLSELIPLTLDDDSEGSDN